MSELAGGRAGRGQLGASQLSSLAASTLECGVASDTELTSQHSTPGLLASTPQLFALIQQKREAERKQKLAVAEALLISKAGKTLHWIRPRPCLPVACGPSGMRLAKASGLSSGRKGWSAPRLSRTLKT